MGCRLVQAATLAAFIHIVFTSEVIAQDPTDLDKEDVPGRMLTLVLRQKPDGLFEVLFNHNRTIV